MENYIKLRNSLKERFSDEEIEKMSIQCPTFERLMTATQEQVLATMEIYSLLDIMNIEQKVLLLKSKGIT